MDMQERTREIFAFRADLLREGYTLKKFAAKEGLPYDMVMRTIQRYWGTDRSPRPGTITETILTRLRAYVDGEHPEPVLSHVEGPPFEPDACEESSPPVPGVGGGPFR